MPRLAHGRRLPFVCLLALGALGIPGRADAQPAGNLTLDAFRPAIDSRECLGAVVSNGRFFYASQASGFIVSQTYGEASKKLPAVWERP